MELDVIRITAMSCIGCLCGVFFMIMGGRYYEKRFEKKWVESWTKYLFPAMACAFASAAFTSYNYSIISVIALDILIAAMFVIARIDGREQIIPNVILVLLFGTRTVLYLVELIIDAKVALVNIKLGFAGLGIFTLMLGGFKFLCKEKLGMGDVKLLMIAGYFLGVYRCSIMFFVALVVSIGHIIIRVITKKMKVKDEISFGPYIAIGNYIALVLGI